MPRMHSCKPVMLPEFELRFRRMLKRIYRSLQQHEIREEVIEKSPETLQIIDERERIMWQWHQLATVVDRLLLVAFSIATLSTILFFLILPVTLRDDEGHPLFL